MISYREDISDWMNKRFVPAEELIRRVMRGEKKIRNQEEVLLTYRVGSGNLDISEHILLPEMLNTTSKNKKLKKKIEKIKEEYKVIQGVSKAISLDEVGLIGVIGQGDRSRAHDIIRAFAAQILVSEVPDNLKVAYVYDSTCNCEWDKYVPLTRTQMENGISLVAGTASKREELLSVLSQALEERKASDGDSTDDTKMQYVVFVDDMELLKGHRIIEDLQANVRDCGFTFIFVADCAEKLPENIEYELVDSPEFSEVYSMIDETRTPIVFDKLSEQKFDKYLKYIEGEKKKVAGRKL